MNFAADLSEINENIRSSMIYELEQIMKCIDLTDSEKIKELKEILLLVCSVGKEISVQDCLDRIFKQIPTFYSPLEDKFLYRAVKSLASLMSGDHYDVRWVYESKDYQLNEDDYENYLSQVQAQMREDIKHFLNSNFDLLELQKYFNDGKVIHELNKLSLV